MHKSPPLSLFTVLALVSLVASACARQAPALPPIDIVDPHVGSTFPSGTEVDLHVTFYGVGGGSNTWQSYEYQLLDNGQVVSQAADIPISQTTLSPTLRSLPDGTHLVVVRGRAARPNPDYAEAANDAHRVYGDWYTSNPLCFFVGANPPEDICSTAAMAQPLKGAAPAASPIPTFASTLAPVIQSLSAFPAPAYYGHACPGLSTITFRAMLALPAGMPPELVEAQAHVTLEVGAGQSSMGSFAVPLLPAAAAGGAAGDVAYSGTLDLSRSYDNASSHFDLSALAGGVGALLWYVDASSHDAAGANVFHLGRTMDQVIDLSPCPVGTLASPRSTPQDSASQGCSQYTNELSCTLADCSWLGSACAISP
jgi:hypothetical protein